MKALLAFFGMTIGSAVGWWLGSLIGLTSAIILGGIGTGVGLYVIRKVVK